jgi:hypothetical protein
MMEIQKCDDEKYNPERIESSSNQFREVHVTLLFYVKILISKQEVRHYDTEKYTPVRLISTYIYFSEVHTIPHNFA